MRTLTFKGFLAQYVKKLSYAGSLDLEKLAAEAVHDNYRLRAPLVLYASVHGKTDLLSDLLKEHDTAKDMLDVLSLLSADTAEQQLQSGSLPEAYQKVWNSFLAARDAPKRDEALKAAMRKKVLWLQAEKLCSNYRIYTDLKLNPGNINSWLKNGDSTKLSYQTAERVMDYVMQFQTLSRPD